MPDFAGQYVCHGDALVVEFLVLVAPLNDDRSIYLHASIEATTLQIRPHRRLSFVHLRFHDAADADRTRDGTDLSAEGASYLGKGLQGFVCVDDNDAIVNIHPNQESQTGGM